MKKFKVQVTIIQEYTVEIDEAIYNDEWQGEFEKNFWNLGNDRNSGIAEALVHGKAISRDSFIEGFGVVTIDGKLPFEYRDETAAEGLNIIVDSENEDIEYDINEIKSH
ncbi:MAG: hypothetical protein U0X91_20805 [Spirosomataceae bacterium]